MNDSQPQEYPCEFRRVTSQEQVATVARLAGRIWTEHYVSIIGQDQVDYMLDRFQSAEAIAGQIAGDYEYYLIQRRGRPVGYVAVVPEPDETSMKLSKIYVEKESRGLGLGRAAVEFVEELCRRRGVRRLWLTVNKHNSSIGFYERVGFANTGPVVQDIGRGFVMDDYRMEKSVRPDEPDR